MFEVSTNMFSCSNTCFCCFLGFCYFHGRVWTTMFLAIAFKVLVNTLSLIHQKPSMGDIQVGKKWLQYVVTWLHVQTPVFANFLHCLNKCPIFVDFCNCFQRFCIYTLLNTSGTIYGRWVSRKKMIQVSSNMTSCSNTCFCLFFL